MSCDFGLAPIRLFLALQLRLCRWLVAVAALLPVSLYARKPVQHSVFTLLKPADYHHNIKKFDAS